jgi:hypothetical protein
VAHTSFPFRPRAIHIELQLLLHFYHHQLGGASLREYWKRHLGAFLSLVSTSLLLFLR